MSVAQRESIKKVLAAGSATHALQDLSQVKTGGRHVRYAKRDNFWAPRACQNASSAKQESTVKIVKTARQVNIEQVTTLIAPFAAAVPKVGTTKFRDKPHARRVIQAPLQKVKD